MGRCRSSWFLIAFNSLKILKMSILRRLSHSFRACGGASAVRGRWRKRLRASWFGSGQGFGCVGKLESVCRSPVGFMGWKSCRWTGISCDVSMPKRTCRRHAKNLMLMPSQGITTLSLRHVNRERALQRPLMLGRFGCRVDPFMVSGSESFSGRTRVASLPSFEFELNK